MSDVWVVIPCHRAYLDKLAVCVQALLHDPEKVVIVTNVVTEPVTEADIAPLGLKHLLTDPSPERNISRWWRMGIDWVLARAPKEHEVFLLNADSVISRDDVQELADELRRLDLSAVAPDFWGITNGEDPVVYLEPKPTHWIERLPGFAMMLAGEAGIRPNERLRWWGSDNELEWQARALKGTGLIPGVLLEHPKKGGTPAAGWVLEWWEEDKKFLLEKWGALDDVEWE